MVAPVAVASMVAMAAAETTASTTEVERRDVF